MNIALMSKIYLGFVGTVMKDVAETGKAMLAKIKTEPTASYEIIRGNKNNIDKKNEGWPLVFCREDY